MGLYHASLRRMRQLINTILEECGVGVEFVATTPAHTIETLAPVLTTAALHRELAASHNLSAGDFDPVAIAAWQASLLTGGAPGAKRKTPGEGDPMAEPAEQRDSELEKKRAKRNHVEPTV